jgi:hypothetical protein
LVKYQDPLFFLKKIELPSLSVDLAAPSSKLCFQVRVPLEAYQFPPLIPAYTILRQPTLPLLPTIAASTKVAVTCSTITISPTVVPTESAKSAPTSRVRIASPCQMNTQIGITTLREFLNALPDAYAATYSRVELIQAFIDLSSTEREELDLGAAHTYNADLVVLSKRLQHRVFLGSIKLAVFLKMIMFNALGETSFGEVVTAFEDCAKIDKENDEMDERRMLE